MLGWCLITLIRTERLLKDDIIITSLLVCYCNFIFKCVIFHGKKVYVKIEIRGLHI